MWLIRQSLKDFGNVLNCQSEPVLAVTLCIKGFWRYLPFRSILWISKVSGRLFIFFNPDFPFHVCHSAIQSQDCSGCHYKFSSWQCPASIWIRPCCILLHYLFFITDAKYAAVLTTSLSVVIQRAEDWFDRRASNSGLGGDSCCVLAYIWSSKSEWIFILHIYWRFLFLHEHNCWIFRVQRHINALVKTVCLRCLEAWIQCLFLFAVNFMKNIWAFICIFRVSVPKLTLQNTF